MFVSALQRVASKPQIIHCKRLNAVVRYAQRTPKKLLYRTLEGSNTVDQGNLVAGQAPPTHLRLYSDAAFKKEEDDGHSVRGALFVRCAGTDVACMQTKEAYGHLIDTVAKKQRNVVRATFSAELRGAGDTLDKAFILAQTMHEIATGENSSTRARHLHQHGGYAVPMCLYIDAYSVFAAITATFIKMPADNGQLVHLHFIREQLDNGVLKALAWIDTRDMIADGMTKGAVDREALHAAMDGIIRMSHAHELWQSQAQSSSK